MLIIFFSLHQTEFDEQTGFVMFICLFIFYLAVGIEHKARMAIAVPPNKRTSDDGIKEIRKEREQ